MNYSRSILSNFVTLESEITDLADLKYIQSISDRENFMSFVVDCSGEAGTAFLHNNIIITAFHVTKGKSIRIGSKKLICLDKDEERDICFYLTRPEDSLFHIPIPGAQVYCQRGGDVIKGYVSRVFPLQIEFPGSPLHGWSGSPIYCGTNHDLVGIYSVHIDVREKGRHLCIQSNKSWTDQVLGKLEKHKRIQIAVPCGTGKSSLLMQVISNSGKYKNILLIEPRVALVQSIGKRIGWKSYVGDAPWDCCDSRTITTHGKAFSKIINCEGFLDGYDLIIMDEAHDGDPISLCIMKYLCKMRKGPSLAMTATPKNSDFLKVSLLYSKHVRNISVMKKNLKAEEYKDLMKNHKKILFQISTKAQALEVMNYATSNGKKFIRFMREDVDETGATQLAKEIESYKECVIAGSNVVAYGVTLDIDCVVISNCNLSIDCELGEVSRLVETNLSCQDLVQWAGRVARTRAGEVIIYHSVLGASEKSVDAELKLQVFWKYITRKEVKIGTNLIQSSRVPLLLSLPFTLVGNLSVTSEEGSIIGNCKEADEIANKLSLKAVNPDTIVTKIVQEGTSLYYRGNNYGLDKSIPLPWLTLLGIGEKIDINGKSCEEGTESQHIPEGLSARRGYLSEYSVDNTSMSFLMWLRLIAILLAAILSYFLPKISMTSMEELMYVDPADLHIEQEQTGSSGADFPPFIISELTCDTSIKESSVYFDNTGLFHKPFGYNAGILKRKQFEIIDRDLETKFNTETTVLLGLVETLIKIIISLLCTLTFSKLFKHCPSLFSLVSKGEEQGRRSRATSGNFITHFNKLIYTSEESVLHLLMELFQEILMTIKMSVNENYVLIKTKLVPIAYQFMENLIIMIQNFRQFLIAILVKSNSYLRNMKHKQTNIEVKVEQVFIHDVLTETPYSQEVGKYIKESDYNNFTEVNKKEITDRINAYAERERGKLNKQDNNTISVVKGFTDLFMIAQIVWFYVMSSMLTFVTISLVGKTTYSKIHNSQGKACESEAEAVSNITYEIDNVFEHIVTGFLNFAIGIFFLPKYASGTFVSILLSEVFETLWRVDIGGGDTIISMISSSLRNFAEKFDSLDAIINEEEKISAIKNYWIRFTVDAATKLIYYLSTGQYNIIALACHLDLPFTFVILQSGLINSRILLYHTAASTSYAVNKCIQNEKRTFLSLEKMPVLRHILSTLCEGRIPNNKGKYKYIGNKMYTIMRMPFSCLLYIASDLSYDIVIKLQSSQMFSSFWYSFSYYSQMIFKTKFPSFKNGYLYEKINNDMVNEDGASINMEGDSFESLGEESNDKMKAIIINKIPSDTMKVSTIILENSKDNKDWEENFENEINESESVSINKNLSVEEQREQLKSNETLNTSSLEIIIIMLLIVSITLCFILLWGRMEEIVIRSTVTMENRIQEGIAVINVVSNQTLTFYNNVVVLVHKFIRMISFCSIPIIIILTYHAYDRIIDFNVVNYVIEYLNSMTKSWNMEHVILFSSTKFPLSLLDLFYVALMAFLVTIRNDVPEADEFSNACSPHEQSYENMREKRYEDKSTYFIEQVCLGFCCLYFLVNFIVSLLFKWSLAIFYFRCLTSLVFYLWFRLFWFFVLVKTLKIRTVVHIFFREQKHQIMKYMIKNGSDEEVIIKNFSRYDFTQIHTLINPAVGPAIRAICSLNGKGKDTSEGEQMKDGGRNVTENVINEISEIRNEEDLNTEETVLTGLGYYNYYSYAENIRALKKYNDKYTDNNLLTSVSDSFRDLFNPINNFGKDEEGNYFDCEEEYSIFEIIKSSISVKTFSNELLMLLRIRKKPKPLYKTFYSYFVVGKRVGGDVLSMLIKALAGNGDIVSEKRILTMNRMICGLNSYVTQEVYIFSATRATLSSGAELLLAYNFSALAKACTKAFRRGEEIKSQEGRHSAKLAQVKEVWSFLNISHIFKIRTPDSSFDYVNFAVIAFLNPYAVIAWFIFDTLLPEGRCVSRLLIFDGIVSTDVFLTMLWCIPLFYNVVSAHEDKKVKSDVMVAVFSAVMTAECSFLCAASDTFKRFAIETFEPSNNPNRLPKTEENLSTYLELPSVSSKNFMPLPTGCLNTRTMLALSWHECGIISNDVRDNVLIIGTGKGGLLQGLVKHRTNFQAITSVTLNEKGYVPSNILIKNIENTGTIFTNRIMNEKKFEERSFSLVIQDTQLNTQTESELLGNRLDRDVREEFVECCLRSILRTRTGGTTIIIIRADLCDLLLRLVDTFACLFKKVTVIMDPIIRGNAFLSIIGVGRRSTKDVITCQVFHCKPSFPRTFEEVIKLSNEIRKLKNSIIDASLIRSSMFEKLYRREALKLEKPMLFPDVSENASFRILSSIETPIDTDIIFNEMSFLIKNRYQNLAVECNLESVFDSYQFCGKIEEPVPDRQHLNGLSMSINTSLNAARLLPLEKSYSVPSQTNEAVVAALKKRFDYKSQCINLEYFKDALKAVTEHCVERARGFDFSVTSWEDLRENANLKSTLGFMSDFKGVYKNIGEILRDGTSHLDSYLETAINSPEDLNHLFHASPKVEKKEISREATIPRLFTYKTGEVRMCEMAIFQKLNEFLGKSKKISFSASGDIFDRVYRLNNKSKQFIKPSFIEIESAKFDGHKEFEWIYKVRQMMVKILLSGYNGNTAAKYCMETLVNDGFGFLILCSGHIIQMKRGNQKSGLWDTSTNNKLTNAAILVKLVSVALNIECYEVFSRVEFEVEGDDAIIISEEEDGKKILAMRNEIYSLAGFPQTGDPILQTDIRLSKFCSHGVGFTSPYNIPIPIRPANEIFGRAQCSLASSSLTCSYENMARSLSTVISYSAMFWAVPEIRKLLELVKTITPKDVYPRSVHPSEKWKIVNWFGDLDIKTFDLNTWVYDKFGIDLQYTYVDVDKTTRKLMGFEGFSDILLIKAERMKQLVLDNVNFEEIRQVTEAYLGTIATEEDVRREAEYFKNHPTFSILTTRTRLQIISALRTGIEFSGIHCMVGSLINRITKTVASRFIVHVDTLSREETVLCDNIMEKKKLRSLGMSGVTVILYTKDNQKVIQTSNASDLLKLILNMIFSVVAFLFLIKYLWGMKKQQEVDGNIDDEFDLVMKTSDKSNGKGRPISNRPWFAITNAHGSVMTRLREVDIKCKYKMAKGRKKNGLTLFLAMYHLISRRGSFLDESNALRKDLEEIMINERRLSIVHSNNPHKNQDSVMEIVYNNQFRNRVESIDNGNFINEVNEVVSNNQILAERRQLPPKNWTINGNMITTNSWSGSVQYGQVARLGELIPTIKCYEGECLMRISDTPMAALDGSSPNEYLFKLQKEFNARPTKGYLIMGESTGHKFRDVPRPFGCDVSSSLKSIKWKEVSLSEKEKTLFFRGGPTGPGFHADDNIRLKIIKETQRMEVIPGTSVKLDLGFNRNHNRIRRGPSGKVGVTEHMELKSAVEKEEWSRFKYLLVMEGNEAPDRILTAMRSGSVVILVEPTFILSGITWYEPLLKHRTNVMIVKGDKEEIFDIVKELENSEELYNSISTEGKKLAISLLKIEIQKDYVSNLMYISKLMGNINAQKRENPNSFSVENVNGCRSTNSHLDSSSTRAFITNSGPRRTLLTTILIMREDNNVIYEKALLLDKARKLFTEAFSTIILKGISRTIDRVLLGKMIFETIFVNVECEKYHSLENGNKVLKSTCNIEAIFKVFKTFNKLFKISQTDMMENMINTRSFIDNNELVSSAFFLYSNITGREKIRKDEYAQVSTAVTGEMMYTGLYGQQVFVKCNKELLWLEKNEEFSCIVMNELDSVEMIRKSRVNSPFYVRIG
uniref:Uncharacterized protein n=1 Tax=viral metagenome TaxID=1070528 RepID=A0A2V0RAW7_9ZZZZ